MSERDGQAVVENELPAHSGTSVEVLPPPSAIPLVIYRFRYVQPVHVKDENLNAIKDWPVMGLRIRYLRTVLISSPSQELEEMDEETVVAVAGSTRAFLLAEPDAPVAESVVSVRRRLTAPVVSTASPLSATVADEGPWIDSESFCNSAVFLELFFAFSSTSTSESELEEE
ncbi:hypothetical protein T265_04995 [Opisthorchis viverrini]|uniref:Uncharacterized protein n=1 Tax=Opisthorchis viverrini TaxID=6198 RepID=A0A074ZL53_OPIVI|nr:hypothetical protein T265_04995 [Opisthorchis viverrini]KER28083.1 hypothetical protein T265_04995 [Opisthorchis viverrini]